MVYISNETEVYTVFTPTLEITPHQLSLYNTYYFSIDNIGRSGNYSDNCVLLSISKISWHFSCLYKTFHIIVPSNISIYYSIYIIPVAVNVLSECILHIHI